MKINCPTFKINIENTENYDMYQVPVLWDDFRVWALGQFNKQNHSIYLS